MPTLIYRQGLPDERAFFIGRAPVVIGRDESCDICIQHRSLSRRHARVEPEGDRLFLVDLQSKNGSFIHGVRITRHEVRVGDAIALGDVELALTGPSAATEQLTGVTSTMDQRAVPTTDDGVITNDAQPTAVKALLPVPFEHLLDAPGRSGALKVTDTEVGQRAQNKLRILLEVSKLLSVPEEVDAVLRKILDLVFQILDVDRGAILLADPRTQRLTPRVVKSLKGKVDHGPIYSQNIVDYVATRSVAALFSDAAADPRIDPSQSILHQSIRSSMCAPLKPKDDVIGVLYVDNLSIPHRFSEEDLDFLAAFASHAATAIESSILYRRIEEEAVTRMRLIMEAKLSSLGMVVAGIAHEVNNPLNFITNFAELSVELVGDLTKTLSAERDRLTPEVADDVEDSLASLAINIAKIAEHGRRAHEIITSMSRHDHGTSGEREPQDLNAVVGESIRIAREETLQGGVEVPVSESYDGSIGPVDMVSTDICRVFVNIINNAFYAMRQKGKTAEPQYAPLLTVKTTDLGDRAEVRIRDNGIGVPTDIADKIFNPFFTTKPPGEGTGLGLSLSYEIITQGHQGTLRLDTAPGEFAEFIVTLPKRASLETEAPATL